MTVNPPGVGGLFVTMAMDDINCPLLVVEVDLVLPPEVDLNENDR
jgi:hypothetical protein